MHVQIIFLHFLNHQVIGPCFSQRLVLECLLANLGQTDPGLESPLDQIICIWFFQLHNCKMLGLRPSKERIANEKLRNHIYKVAFLSLKHQFLDCQTVSWTCVLVLTFWQRLDSHFCCNLFGEKIEYPRKVL